jgi:speckle-type POZ protein
MDVVCRISHAVLLLLFAAVMDTEGFNYLEETCPSLLSDLLATVAVVDDDHVSVNRKRRVCGNEGATPVESVEASERRTRRRF